MEPFSLKQPRLADLIGCTLKALLTAISVLAAWSMGSLSELSAQTPAPPASIESSATEADNLSRVLRVAWVNDSRQHAVVNRSEANYWAAYWPEILSELGLEAESIPPETLNRSEPLSRYSALIVEQNKSGELTTAQQQALSKWVEQGGILIISQATNLEAITGNRAAGRLAQPDGEFSCAATFALSPHRLTRGIHSRLQPDQRLLAFSDVHLSRPESSSELARAFDLAGQDTGCAAITERRLGRGRVYAFGFSVAQTMWVLHQGRPVDRDYDGDSYLRRSDAIVIRPHSIEVGYADEILFLLQNLLGIRPHPMVHQLPPTPDGDIPAALFHWGGDDEGDRTGLALRASNWMRERGLPYHINAMPWPGGRFGLNAEEARRIRANGHDVSIHFNFIDAFPTNSGFAQADIAAQAAAFRREFGQEFTCSVNHWCRWTGWAEPAKWMRAAGGLADNSFTHAGSPPYNPVNLLGFSFGTSFPFWFYDDWRGRNQRIDFLEQPVTAYECGYVGQERTDFATLHKVIDQAALHHLTMNMFYHPIYIDQFPHCRAAIEETLRYLKARGITAVHLSSDGLYRWWKARSETRVQHPKLSGSTLRFRTQTAHPEGAVIKIPLGGRAVQAVRANDRHAHYQTEERFGQRWLLLVVPPGRTRVECELPDTTLRAARLR